MASNSNEVVSFQANRKPALKRKNDSQDDFQLFKKRTIHKTMLTYLQAIFPQEQPSILFNKKRCSQMERNPKIKKLNESKDMPELLAAQKELLKSVDKIKEKIKKKDERSKTWIVASTDELGEQSLNSQRRDGEPLTLARSDAEKESGPQKEWNNPSKSLKDGEALSDVRETSDGGEVNQEVGTLCSSEESNFNFRRQKRRLRLWNVEKLNSLASHDDTLVHKKFRPACKSAKPGGTCQSGVDLKHGELPGGTSSRNVSYRKDSFQEEEPTKMEINSPLLVDKGGHEAKGQKAKRNSDFNHGEFSKGTPSNETKNKAKTLDEVIKELQQNNHDFQDKNPDCEIIDLTSDVEGAQECIDITSDTKEKTSGKMIDITSDTKEKTSGKMIGGRETFGTADDGVGIKQECGTVMEDETGEDDKELDEGDECQDENETGSKTSGTSGEEDEELDEGDECQEENETGSKTSGTSDEEDGERLAREGEEHQNERGNEKGNETFGTAGGEDDGLDAGGQNGPQKERDVVAGSESSETLNEASDENRNQEDFQCAIGHADELRIPTEGDSDASEFGRLLIDERSSSPSDSGHGSFKHGSSVLSSSSSESSDHDQPGGPTRFRDFEDALAEFVTFPRRDLEGSRRLNTSTLGNRCPERVSRRVRKNPLLKKRARSVTSTNPLTEDQDNAERFPRSQEENTPSPMVLRHPESQNQNIEEDGDRAEDQLVQDNENLANVRSDNVQNPMNAASSTGNSPELNQNVNLNANFQLVPMETNNQSSKALPPAFLSRSAITPYSAFLRTTNIPPKTENNVLSHVSIPADHGYIVRTTKIPPPASISPPSEVQRASLQLTSQEASYLSSKALPPAYQSRPAITPFLRTTKVPPKTKNNNLSHVAITADHDCMVQSTKIPPPASFSAPSEGQGASPLLTSQEASNQNVNVTPKFRLVPMETNYLSSKALPPAFQSRSAITPFLRTTKVRRKTKNNNLSHVAITADHDCMVRPTIFIPPPQIPPPASISAPSEGQGASPQLTSQEASNQNVNVTPKFRLVPMETKNQSSKALPPATPFLRTTKVRRKTKNNNLSHVAITADHDCMVRPTIFIPPPQIPPPASISPPSEGQRPSLLLACLKASNQSSKALLSAYQSRSAITPYSAFLQTTKVPPKTKNNNLSHVSITADHDYMAGPTIFIPPPQIFPLPSIFPPSEDPRAIPLTISLEAENNGTPVIWQNERPLVDCPQVPLASGPSNLEVSSIFRYGAMSSPQNTTITHTPMEVNYAGRKRQQSKHTPNKRKSMKIPRNKVQGAPRSVQTSLTLFRPWIIDPPVPKPGRKKKCSR